MDTKICDKRANWAWLMIKREVQAWLKDLKRSLFFASAHLHRKSLNVNVSVESRIRTIRRSRTTNTQTGWPMPCVQEYSTVQGLYCMAAPLSLSTTPTSPRTLLIPSRDKVRIYHAMVWFLVVMSRLWCRDSCRCVGYGWIRSVHLHAHTHTSAKMCTNWSTKHQAKTLSYH